MTPLHKIQTGDFVIAHPVGHPDNFLCVKVSFVGNEKTGFLVANGGTYCYVCSVVDAGDELFAGKYSALPNLKRWLQIMAEQGKFTSGLLAAYRKSQSIPELDNALAEYAAKCLTGELSV